MEQSTEHMKQEIMILLSWKELPPYNPSGTEKAVYQLGIKEEKQLLSPQKAGLRWAAGSIHER